MSAQRLIRLSAVEQKTGLKRAWIYAQASADNFPKPVKIGSRASAWVESEVDDWIARQIDVSRKKERTS